MPSITTAFDSVVRSFLHDAMKDAQDIDDDEAAMDQHQQQEDERPQYSFEFVFRDTIENVLQYLNAYELCQVAQVCKFLDQAVHREFSKRKPELVLFPDTFDRRLTPARGNDFQISKIMNTRPELVVMFCGPRPHLRSVLDLEFTILREYKKRLPNRVIILGVHISVYNDEEIRSSPTDFGRTQPNGLQALLFSRYRQLEIKIASCESYERAASKLSHRMMNHLVMDDPHQQATLLFFGREQFSTCTKILELLRHRFIPNTYKLWGFLTSDVVKLIDIPKKNFPSYLGMESFIGVRITGPNLKSYTCVFDLADKKSESQRKLAEFASKIDQKKHTIGLISGPRHIPFDLMMLTGRARPRVVEYQNFKDIIELVRTVFPKIDLSAVFNSPDGKSFGFDSSNDVLPQKFMHVNAASLMILTFD